MKSDTFTFQAPDGTEIFVHRWLPDGEVKGALQIAHGLAEHAARYARFAEAATARGYAVYADDHRGHGQTAPTDADLGLWAEEGGWNKILGDLHQLNRHMAKEHPGVPLLALGHSWGSLLFQNFVFAYPGDVDGVILSGTGATPAWLANAGRMLSRVERRRIGKRGKSPALKALVFGAYNKKFKPNRTEFDWLSRDPLEVDKYIDDKFCGYESCTESWFEMFTGVAHISQQSQRERIPNELPLLLLSGENDPLHEGIKNLEGLRDNYKKAGVQDVELKIFPDGRHESLNETNRDEVTDFMLDWFDARRDRAAERQKSAA
jgi:alpha-beta hydrolase superfamily lysophospholipase